MMQSRDDVEYKLIHYDIYYDIYLGVWKNVLKLCDTTPLYKYALLLFSYPNDSEKILNLARMYVDASAHTPGPSRRWMYTGYGKSSVCFLIF